jgi:hypothetical protein
MRISSNPEIQQIVQRFVSPACGDRSLPYQAAQHLGDLKI